MHDRIVVHIRIYIQRGGNVRKRRKRACSGRIERKGRFGRFEESAVIVGRSHRDRIDISRGGIRIVEEEEEEKYDECSVLKRKGK